MASLSAQGVVERASAELSKRISGLRAKQAPGPHSQAAVQPPPACKASVMERVTNALCGVGAVAAPAPDKPQRASRRAKALGLGLPVRTVPSAQCEPLTAQMPPPPRCASWAELLADEAYLSRLFLYFSAGERRVLAQVCSRWRAHLYQRPRLWTGLVPVVRVRELRAVPQPNRVDLYTSLVSRGFQALCLVGAADEDALDVVRCFPAASTAMRSLSLRCCSISDRGLETLVEHMQVGPACLPASSEPSPHASYTHFLR